MSDDPAQNAPAAPQAQEDIRARVREVMTAEGLPMTAVAKDAAIAYGTFSAWMGGTYAGRNDRVEEQVARWLTARKTAERTRALTPPPVGFQRTPFAETAFALFAHAQYVPDMAILTGGAGIGKSSAVCAYKQATPNVWVVTGEPCLASPRGVLEELRDTLGIEEYYSSQAMSRAIVRRLRGTKGLLIVDEAQHLTTQALDQLRTIYDKAEVGVALVGNETVYSRLQGTSRQAAYAQLFSRVGMRVPRARPERADIDTLLDAWGVAGERERKLLHVIARKPGALRGMTKTLRVAHMLALGASEPMEARHIRLAWERLSSGEQVEAA